MTAHKNKTEFNTKTAKQGPPSIVLDREKYRKAIAKAGLTKEEENEYLEAVWAILLQAMQLAIYIDTDGNACGKSPENSADSAESSGNVVYSGVNHLQKRFSFAVDVEDQQTSQGSR